jgi:hypothetical protein
MIPESGQERTVAVRGHPVGLTKIAKLLAFRR